MTSVDRTNTRTRTRAALGVAITLIGLGAAATACSVPLVSNPVDIAVVDRETGQDLRVWRHHGRLFVAGEPGARYGLRVTNHTDGRVLVVMSVDGVNILSGQTAGYDQMGYVLSAYGSTVVNGWRKSNTEVAAFAFAPLPQSYAARTGRPDDVGVIGMAVFKERAVAQLPDYVAPDESPWRGAPPPKPQIPPSASSAPSDSRAAGRPLAVVPLHVPAPSAAAPGALRGETFAQRPDEKLGTAHGAREWSVVNVTMFERATSHPESVRRIEYDTYANLVASGVIPRSLNGDRPPRPFPSNPEGMGFVPDPPVDP
jgi:hypothetical protein